MTPLPHNYSELPLLDELATGVVCLDDALRVRYLNAAAEQVLGASARTMLGEPLTQLIELPDRLLTRLHETIENGQPFTDREVSLTTHSGEARTVDCSISPYPAQSPQPGLMLELLVVDRSLRIARDEAMLTQQEHVRSLLRGLAHEIKNPLGGLRGAAQLLERQLNDAELTDYTSIIIREADRLQSLIDRMLGPATALQHTPVNVHEVLQHVRRIATAGASTDITVEVDYDPSIPEFSSDRDRLVQVFLNIVGNAVHALGEKGCIRFRTRVMLRHTIGGQRHALVAAVSIMDDGPGVPRHLINQIFYPMVTGTDHGTGLGLSIAQSIMSQLGGLIEVTSTPGDTKFTVLRPLELSDG